MVVCAFVDLIYALKSEVIKNMRCSTKMYYNIFIGDKGVSKPNFKCRSGKVSVLKVTILAVG